MPVKSSLACVPRASGVASRGLVSVTHGHGQALAVVMAPVMPCWDDGAFFAPITERLVALGYRVMIFDSLSLQPAPDDFDAYAGAWGRVLKGLGPVQLLAGAALGGALVQSLLDTRWAAQIPLTLLISAPTRADIQLDQRLGQMASLATCGELPQALRWLDYWVAPDPCNTANAVVRGLAPERPGLPTETPKAQTLTSQPTQNPVVRGLAPEGPGLPTETPKAQTLTSQPTQNPVVRGLAPEGPGLPPQSCPLAKPPHHERDPAYALACARLTKGFSLLRDLDVTDAVKPYPGKLLSIYGEQSQLVRATNISFLRTERHLAVSIPGSGMRPHIEQPAQVWACVQEHLHITAQIAV